MKKILIVSFLLLSVNLFAQKYGHCDVNLIATKLPELVEIDKQVNAKTTELEGRLQRMYEVYQKKISDFQASVNTMTPAQQKTAAEEIQNLEVRIQEAQQNSQQELQQYDLDLKKPLFEKVKKAIDDVSAENGFTLVFDVSTGTVLYAGGVDVNDLVLQKLGIQ
jgi:outer membrane protein